MLSMVTWKMKQLLNKHLDLPEISRQMLKINWLFLSVYKKIIWQKEMSKQKNLSVYRQSLEGIKRGQDLLGWKTQLLSSPVCWLAKYSPKIM